MKNLKRTLAKALGGLALILFAAGCADILKTPPGDLDPAELGDGQVVITIGIGPERTVFPQLDQFSKITLSFEQQDGTGTMPPVEAHIGSAVISLIPGTWEITASAYNTADPPVVVALAKNTLTNTGGAITGDPYFALAPVGTGPGILRYTVAFPSDLALDAAQSRIQIEKDGAPLITLNDDGFIAGVKTIDGAITGSLSLEPGRYAVDIVLDDSGSADTAVYRTAVAILPGLATDIVFVPEAGDFLDPDARTALTGAVSFGRTQKNSSGTVIGPAGGEGVNRTRSLMVSRGTGTAYFTLTKGRTQTISLDPAAAGKVSWTESGTVDGSAASETHAVFTVDTGDLAGPGGNREFLFSLEEPGKTPLVYTLTVIVPHLVGIVIDEPPEILICVQGPPLSLQGIKVTGTWSDFTSAEMPVSAADISGFDPTKIGEQFLRISKNGVTSSNGFTVTMIEREASDLFFDCGQYDKILDTKPNRFSVVLGRTLVLAPVKWCIPDDVVYEWKVNNVAQDSTTEYLSFSPLSTGEYAITVTAKANDGSPIASASTTVVCVPGPQLRLKTGSSKAVSKKLYAYVAPGQFGEMEGGLYGAGGFGGYTVFEFDHSVERKGVNGEEMLIGGNAFGGWNEPGIIWVMQDENRNGLPDDTWYELIGSHAAVSVRRYAVKYETIKNFWVDNLGRVEPTLRSAKHTIFTGTMLPASLNSVNVLWGYADITSNGRISLSNAVQMDGSPITLDFIDFVKVQAAINHDSDPFGERSTEATIPTDRNMPNPAMLVNGADDGSGQYEYTFLNLSGYDMTVEFRGTAFSLIRNGGTATKTSVNASEYIDFYGGNVIMTISGSTVTFRDG
jgi:hypothetical protein